MMAPTPMPLVTAAITELMRARASGIFQLTGAADAAYLDIARYLADRIGAPPGLVEERERSRDRHAGGIHASPHDPRLHVPSGAICN